MRALATTLLAGVAGLWACSPFGGGAFRCETDADCAGGPSAGRCETAVGFCSFDDSSCESGRRYGTASGAQSGVCVGEEVPIDAPPDITDGEMPIDMPPGIDARLCYGVPHEVCLTTLPSGPRTLPATINTDTDCDQVVSPAGGVPLCVVSGAQITINNTRAEGARPLVIVATETINITGNLDVSSKRGQTAGAGANAAACVAATMGENDGGGAAGGGGGGFGANGGDAGNGDNNNGGAQGNAAGGDGGNMSLSMFIRGGCRGANGGSTNGPNNGSDNGTNFGAGGSGGGAVYLIAGTSITVATNGSITASGAGGSPGLEQSGGGGGGGSGGLVGLDAMTITVMGKIAANGGGGGGGAGLSDGGNGGDGHQPGSTADWNQRAGGGTAGNQSNSPGGQGGATGNLAGGNTNNSDGGSGGAGGGVGVIWGHGTVTGTQISPPVTAH